MKREISSDIYTARYEFYIFILDSLAVLFQAYSLLVLFVLSDDLKLVWCTCEADCSHFCIVK